jgi:hypothetical protein
MNRSRSLYGPRLDLVAEVEFKFYFPRLQLSLTFRHDFVPGPLAPLPHYLSWSYLSD